MEAESVPRPAAALPGQGGTDLASLPEYRRVLHWRVDPLAAVGYTDDACVALASRADVDLHRATDLLLNGCPQETALHILL